MHPSFFLSCHFFIFVSNDVSIFTGGAYDEGPNGLLPIPGDSGGLCKGEGRVEGGEARGAEYLEGCLVEQAWPDEKAPGRGKGADGGTEKSA